MAICVRATDISFLKHLHNFVAFFALVPPYATQQGFHLMLRKVYESFLIVGLVYIYIASLLSKMNLEYSNQYVTLTGVDLISSTVQIGSLILTLTRSAFFTSSSFVSFLSIFAEIDKFFRIQGRPCRKFYVEIIAAHVYLVGLLVYNLYFWHVSVGLGHYLRYSLRDVTLYLNAIRILLMYNYILAIRYRFKQLNERLKESHRTVYADKFDANKLGFPETSQENWIRVRQLRKIFSRLNSLVTIFNNTFGWQILTLCFIILTGILETVNYMIVAWVVYKNSVGTIEWKVNFFFIGLLWSVTLLIMGVMVSTICENTSKEIKKVTILCYRLLLNVPASSNNAEERTFRRELILLVNQAESRPTTFSAAGFFDVNYRMLFGLLGSVTSYIIVIIQINK